MDGYVQVIDFIVVFSLLREMELWVNGVEVVYDSIDIGVLRVID